jgi:hypothetical protein
MKIVKTLAIVIAAASIFTATAIAQVTRPTVYLEPQNGFENLALSPMTQELGY